MFHDPIPARMSNEISLNPKASGSLGLELPFQHPTLSGHHIRLLPSQILSGPYCQQSTIWQYFINDVKGKFYSNAEPAFSPFPLHESLGLKVLKPNDSF